MSIEPSPLPYDRSALEPHLSADTVEAHHGRQQALIEQVNAAVAGTELAELPLQEIVRRAQGALFNHASQAWNDAFYWEGLRPSAGGGGGEPEGRLAEAINRTFGDFARFKAQFAGVAERLFGSGWLWLLQRGDGALAVAATANAASPLTGEDTPLLACCLWEHAYYLDYRHARGKYLEAFWNIVDWRAVDARMK
ncbi:superoxide dismutase [Luteimonas aquatica]|uniref:superoxide dismutase n=1 Tax=Luteimonas aquatica TaxID=450364 RepID=UPI001F55B0CD|nr:Fe-Mn family superoxide dismutase [Luteimonas aquatica]